MEWKKSNISSSELERQQEAYIKEALEMAKRSITGGSDKAAAEKLAAEKAAAEKLAAEKAAAEKAAAEKAAAEKLAAEKEAAEKAAAEKETAEKSAAEEFTKFSNEIEEDDMSEEPGCKKEKICCEQSADVIDIAELKNRKALQRNSGNSGGNNPNPSTLNGYVNEHNNKAQCNCPNCQRKRMQH